MKLLLVSEAWAPGEGPFDTMCRYYREILTAAGYEVDVVDNKAMHLPIGGQTAWNCPRFFRALGWVRWNNWIVNAMLRRRVAAWQPDVVLVFKGENIRWRTLARLKRESRTLLFNWDMDHPFWGPNTSMDLIRGIPFYDCFGSLAQHFIPSLLGMGCPRAEYMPMFFIPERFALPEPLTAADHARFDADLLFVGRFSPERADMLRPLAQRNLAVYGPDWDRDLAADDPLRRCIRGGFLAGLDYAKALHCCRIAINVLVTQCKGANNLRTFEATGCGAFLLTEHSREQAEVLFRDGEEVVCYRDPGELAQIAQRFLDDDPARIRIAAAGQQRCLAEHTLAHRLQNWLRLAEELRR